MLYVQFSRIYGLRETYLTKRSMSFWYSIWFFLWYPGTLMRPLLSGALLEVKESLTMVFVRQGAEGSDEGKMYARSSQFAHDDA